METSRENLETNCGDGGKKLWKIKQADVAELVDARDLKSLDGNVVWVRVPPPAPAFAREASEGCRAEAGRRRRGCVRELRLGKPRETVRSKRVRHSLSAATTDW